MNILRNKLEKMKAINNLKNDFNSAVKTVKILETRRKKMTIQKEPLYSLMESESVLEDYILYLHKEIRKLDSLTEITKMYFYDAINDIMEKIKR